MCRKSIPKNPVRNSSASLPLRGKCGTSFGGKVKKSYSLRFAEEIICSYNENPDSIEKRVKELLEQKRSE